MKPGENVREQIGRRVRSQVSSQVYWQAWNEVLERSNRQEHDQSNTANETDWIDCTDRLPAERETVLIWLRDCRTPDVAHLDGKTWHEQHGHTFDLYEAVCWKPIVRPALLDRTK